MAELTRDRHVALLIPDSRVEVWTAQCSGTQAGPRAGVPEPEQSALLALGATGDQTASSAGVEIATRRSGYPVRGWSIDSVTARGLDRGAAFVWRAVGGAATSWYGWDPPRSIQDWQGVVWTDGSGNLKHVKDPYILTAQNGDLLILAQVRESGAAGGEYRYECIRRTAASSTWTRVLIEGEATSPSQDYIPCGIVLPSGRIVAYRWKRDSASVTINGLRMWYSDDAGLTWSFSGDGIAGRSTGNTITRTRVAYSGQQALLLALNSSGNIEQYASSDLGSTYEYVGLADATNAYVGHDVEATDDGFVVAYIGGDTSSTALYSRRIGNAYEIFESAPEVEVATGIGATSEAALCLDDTGMLSLHVRSSANSSQMWTYISGDNGDTWSQFGEGVGEGLETVVTGDAATYIDTISATWWRGQVVLAHQWSADPGNEDDSLGAAYLGGYTQVTLPRYRRNPAMTGTAGWSTTWLPFDLPSDCGWTAAGVAGTEALITPGRLDLATVAANTRTYTQTITGVIADGTMVLIDFAAVSGGDPTTNQRGIRVRLADGAATYDVEVRIGTAGFRVYDGVAGTLIGSAVTLDVTARTQILVAVASSTVSTWYRTASTTGGARAWTVGPTTATLSNGGITDANGSLVWGHRAAGIADAETYWYHVAYMSGAAVGQNIAIGLTNPTDLTGRLYAWRGPGVYVADGVSIQARSGPTVTGEAWTIATAYDYGRDRVLDPRPRRTYRSTDLATGETIAFRWATTGDTPLDSGLVGIALFGKNLGRVTVAWYDADTTSWVNSSTHDLYLSGNYTLSGESAVPASDAPAIGYVARDEWRGASIEVDDTAWEVAHHPDGRWSSTAKPQLRVHLADADAALITANGVARVVPRQALIIIPITATYSGVKITQAAPDANNPTVFQTYWEIGRVVIGAVHILADDPAWGRAVEYQDGAEVAEARDGSRYARIAAPQRRVVELSWTDGVDTSGPSSGRPDTYGAHDARSAAGGTPAALAGIQRAIDGGAGQLVYIPRLTGGHTQILQRRDEFVLVRPDGPVRIESVQGDELADEIVRVATLPLVEDV